MTDNTNIPPTTTPPDATTPPQEEESFMNERIDRLSGEPAPDISPDEFARLQRGGGLNLDARGRVRVSRDTDDDPGVSLRKRRAWYTR